MSFKLLALRILDGTDQKLIKNLSINTLYQFYSDYTFKTSTGKIISPYNHSNVDIEYIEYKESTPIHLYGQNISISAIVGKNGSGKSSLLELFYFIIHCMNDIDVKLEFSTSINVELFYLINNQIHKLRIYSEDRSGLNISKSIFNPTNHSVYKKVLGEEILSTLDFYSIVLNYSIYGLNSEIMGNYWIKNIFHKNDGYQVPIVINPMRTNGNIDINKEYLLAQSRLILYKYLISRENKNIIETDDKIKISRINFLLDLNKCQYIKYPNDDKEFLIIDELIKTSTKIYNNDFKSSISNQHAFSHLLENLFHIVNISNQELINTIVKIYEENSKIKLLKRDELRGSYNEDLKLLCILYVFKKIIRITQNYAEYDQFYFIFNEYSPLNEGFNIEISAPTCLNEYIKNNIEIDKENYFTLKDIEKEDLGKIALDELLEKTISGGFLYDVTNRTTKKTLNLINDFIKDTQYKEKLSYQIINSLDTKIKYNIDSFYNAYKNEFLAQLHKNSDFLKFCFNKLIKKLKDDTSHITFKLKQALNYFKNNLFSKINIDEEYLNKERQNLTISGPGKKTHLFPLEIEQTYFENINNIEETPIAFFTPIIYVSKNDIEYEFDKLSSGEQQYIHTILNVIYHIYNIASVIENQSDKKLYRKINLIFDEIELYFHPEYQRTFINDLINNLNEISKVNTQLEFNILFSSHSPFILSDIPSQNVLKLKDGKPFTNNEINSFGSNIYDLLKDEFFMENGTIGEYAVNLIKDINKFIGNGRNTSQINDETITKYIDLIGEPVLRTALREAYFSKKSPSDIDEEIDRLTYLRNKKR